MEQEYKGTARSPLMTIGRASLISTLLLSCSPADQQGTGNDSSAAKAGNAERVTLRCEGTVRSTVTVEVGAAPTVVKSLTQTYRLDLEKRDIELWDSKKGTYYRICKSPHCLKYSAENVHVKDDLISDSGHIELSINRENGTVDSYIWYRYILEQGKTLLSEERFIGECKKVAKATAISNKF